MCLPSGSKSGAGRASALIWTMVLCGAICLGFGPVSGGTVAWLGR